MLRVGELSLCELSKVLRGPGLRLRTGAYSCRLQSDLPELAAPLARLYAEHALADEHGFTDFHVRVEAGRGLRRWIRPQALFSVDEVQPFKPQPRAQALPMMEWGLNWCITAYCHDVLVLHAAAVARGGRVLILPAPPGSGKSTLCAALVSRGWQLLSDELSIIRLDNGLVTGLARPVSLKNGSIELMHRFAPDSFMSEPVYDTSKGTVALLAPPPQSVREAGIDLPPAWVVLPRWRSGAATRLTPKERGATFMALAGNAMNYHLLGPTGFAAIGRLAERCAGFDFEYSQLDEAVALFDELAAS